MWTTSKRALVFPGRRHPSRSNSRSRGRRPDHLDGRHTEIPPPECSPDSGRPWRGRIPPTVKGFSRMTLSKSLSIR